MQVLCVSGSRADLGGISAVYEALKRYDHLHTDLWDMKKQGDPRSISIKYNLAVVLGDRSEILKTVIQLFLDGLIIAHLSGGDITEGSQDDSMRHAITKLSHLHFPTNEESAKRIIQMGEEPWRVHTVGYPGIDDLKLESSNEARNKTNILEWNDFVLVVWHPDTLTNEKENIIQVRTLIKALNKLKLNYLVIGPNNDKHSAAILEILKNWAEAKNHRFFYSLDRSVYLTLLGEARCLVGNSSSGFYEAPEFGTRVINIGDRQKGRIKPENVIDCPIEIDAIIKSVKEAYAGVNIGPVDSIYAKGNAATRIAKVISEIDDPKRLLNKKFIDYFR